MIAAVTGPNCIDPNICRGACCSIKIDIPKVLAEEYVKRGYAIKEDFIRSDTFAFQLRFNEKTGKCFLFDPKINGCSIHNSGIKPVQCWIYPTGFRNSNKGKNCKRSKGWNIVSPLKAKKAEEILRLYLFLCKIEAKKELRKIRTRIKAASKNNESEISAELIEKLKKVKPSEIAGFVDKWDSIDILFAEGLSLQMKKFCLNNNPECSMIPNNYFECKGTCELICKKLYEYISISLYEFIKENGQDPDGQYPLIKLFNFTHLVYAS
ncbi:MAG: hypothetical protein ACFFKA_04415 [Candidatus Thorarchaeota archaeon]